MRYRYRNKLSRLLDVDQDRRTKWIDKIGEAQSHHHMTRILLRPRIMYLFPIDRSFHPSALLLYECLFTIMVVG